MPFPYKKALVIGATSGIGKELTQRLLRDGVPVIAVGRRRHRLQQLAVQGDRLLSAVPFDIANINEIPKFADSITKSHPDLDVIFLNAGVQQVMDFSKPHTVDISKFQNELTINYMAMVTLTHAFMPFFQYKSTSEEVAFIYTSTSLISVPYPPTVGYCASKAALHSFILSAREQIKQNPADKILLSELIVPLVQTELHDGQPGWGPNFNPGMPVDAFVNEALKGVEQKMPVVAVGRAAQVYEEFEAEKDKRVAPNWEVAKKNLRGAHRFD